MTFCKDLQFHQNKQFQYMVCCRYLRFQQWFNVDDLGFQIELCCRYFGLFGLETFGATF
jgi:hypothetical protein